MVASLDKRREHLLLGNQAEIGVGSVSDSGSCFGSSGVLWILGSVFGFWEVFWILGSVSWILRSVFGFWEVLYILGSVFGFWEVFWILGSVLDSEKCFWILGSVLNSGKCLWILRSVFGFWIVFLDSGKCFVFVKVFCPYEPPYITDAHYRKTHN